MCLSPGVDMGIVLSNNIFRATPKYPGIHPVFLHTSCLDLADSTSGYLLGTVALTVVLQALDLTGTNAITQLLNQVVETND